MTGYHTNDLKSTLVYIKDQFGIDVFQKYGRVTALFSDLAPELKSERIMLDRMSKIGILKDFVSVQDSDDSTKRRTIARALTILTTVEYIQQRIAAEYISIIVEVFGWDISVDIPPEPRIEEMKFDVYRYSGEANDYTYIQAREAFVSEDFHNAEFLFSMAHDRGNILAGIKLGQMYYSGQVDEVDGKKNNEEALKLFLEGFNAGYPLACGWIAEVYRLGRGVPRDEVRAQELSLFCRNAMIQMSICGDSDAQYMYGWNLLYGILCVENKDEGFYWLNRAAEAKHLGAMVEIAICYLEGYGCVRDIDRGLQLMEQYACTSSKKAHYKLGKMYLYGNCVEKDYKKALSLLFFATEKGYKAAQRCVDSWFEKVVEDGDVYAMIFLAYIYVRGEEVKKDISNAESWLERAEQQIEKAETEEISIRKGHFEIAELYYRYFFNDEKKQQLALKHYYRAFEQGDKDALYDAAWLYFIQKIENEYVNLAVEKWLEILKENEEMSREPNLSYLLGNIYYLGSKIKRDYDEAEVWYLKAVSKGSLTSLCCLAQIYINIRYNYKEGVRYLETARREGVPEGIKLLGDCYKNGIGVKKSRSQAKALYKEAAEMGDMDAAEELKRLWF